MSNIESEFIINNGTLKEYSGSDVKVFVPEGVHTIGRGAFESNQTVVEVILPDRLAKIEGDAFSNCLRLRKINIPDTVKSIGECAFRGCKKLADISLSSEVSVGYHAFEETKWLKNYFKEHDTLIVGQTLIDARRDLKEYTIPDGVERIGDFAFCCNEIEIVNIPNSVTSIGAYSFADSKIKKITIPFSVRKIEEQAFCECKKLESIFIPETVITIENQALAKIPNAVVTIISADEETGILNKNNN